MAEVPDNLVLRYLRGMDAKLDRVVEDVQDLKVRMTAVKRPLPGSIAGPPESSSVWIASKSAST